MRTERLLPLVLTLLENDPKDALATVAGLFLMDDTTLMYLLKQLNECDISFQERVLLLNITRLLVTRAPNQMLMEKGDTVLEACLRSLGCEPSSSPIALTTYVHRDVMPGSVIYAACDLMSTLLAISNPGTEPRLLYFIDYI